MSKKHSKGGKKELAKEVKELFIYAHKGNLGGLVKRYSWWVHKGEGVVDFGDNTLLHVASRAQKIEVVGFLLAHHFSIKRKNKEGMTAKDYAKGDVLKLIEKYDHGINRFIRQSQQQTTLTPNGQSSSGGVVSTTNSDWMPIKNQKKEILKTISIAELDKTVDHVRCNFKKLGELREEVGKKYLEGTEFERDVKEQERLLGDNMKITSTVDKSIARAKETYEKYQKRLRKLKDDMMMEIEEIELFLEEMASSYEKRGEKGDAFEKHSNFVSYASVLMDEKKEEIKKNKNIVGKFEKKYKKYMDLEKKYQKNKIQYKMKELKGKGKSKVVSLTKNSKLKKESSKVNKLENEIITRRRNLENLENQIYLKKNGDDKDLFVCSNKLEMIQIKKQINEGFFKTNELREIFFKLNLESDIFFPLVKNNLLSDRSFEDYENLIRFNQYQNQFLMGYLKGELLFPEKKLLKVIDPNEFKNTEFINEFVSMIGIRNEHFVEKYLFNFHKVLFYKSSETKEKKIVLEFPYLETTLYHWVKKAYDEKLTYEEIMGMERKRTKRQIKKIVKSLCNLLFYQKKNNKMKLFRINPVNIRVTSRNKMKLINYSLENEEVGILTEMFKPKREKFKLKKENKEKYPKDNCFKSAALIVFELLAKPENVDKYGDFPSYFTKNEISFITKLENGDESVMEHEFWEEESKEEKLEGTLELEDFQKQNETNPKFEYSINLSSKKEIAPQLLYVFYPMKTMDDLLGIFKGKFGIDGFGNISPFIWENFWKNCEKREFFDGRKMGYFLPTDKKRLTTEFEGIGRILLKLLIEKRSELKPVFTPYVISFLLDENMNTGSKWETYCQLYDKKYYSKLKHILKDNNLEQLKLMYKLGEEVNDNNKSKFLKKKCKEKLIGNDYRIENLLALRKGFSFTLDRKTINSLRVKDLIQFFCAKKKLFVS